MWLRLGFMVKKHFTDTCEVTEMLESLEGGGPPSVK